MLLFRIESRDHVELQAQFIVASTLGSVVGDSIVGGMQPGMDWRNAPDQFDAETARLNRSAVTQVDANTIIDNRPLQSSPGADAFYDQLVSMMNNPAEVDTSGATQFAAGPGFSLDGGSTEPRLSGPGLRLPGDPAGVRIGVGSVDTMGQPLVGRSDYHAFSKLSDILTSSNGE